VSARGKEVVGGPALHCFQKKSKRGTATPLADMELIRKRLGAARMHQAKNGPR
jgi:phage-related protein